MLQFKYGGGNKVEVTAPAEGYSAGQVVVIGKLVGVCPVDASEGRLVGLAMDGNFDGDAVSTETWATGDDLYVIPATAKGTLTKTSTGNTFFGRAIMDKIAGATKARAMLIQKSPAT